MKAIASRIYRLYAARMADPRIYRACLGHEADTSTGLAVARRLVATCGKPPLDITVWASLAPSTIASVATLLPHEILSADITMEPCALQKLAEVLGGDPRVHNWFVVQRASAFGSALGVGSPHPSRHDGSSSTVTLDFGGDPVPEAIGNGRFGRWLDDLAAAGLLPDAVSRPGIMQQFAARFTPWPVKAARSRVAPQPFDEGGVRVTARGGRVMRGDRDWYWPGACQLTIPAEPVTALSRAAPLFAPGGPVEFHGYYSASILGQDGLAERLAASGTATFVLHTSDGDDTDLDEATVDALLGMTDSDLVCVEWQCDWPEAVPGYNGVQLTANGVGNLHDDDPEHVPGATAVYVTVHPRGPVDLNAFAARLGDQAGVHLTPS